MSLKDSSAVLELSGSGEKEVNPWLQLWPWVTLETIDRAPFLSFLFPSAGNHLSQQNVSVCEI
ncbi:hypothetical protein JZ751_022665 [Albula glossodonta]|uniref:Uncharacterized protein n=1 Tax=Albula glossodonta TaxID=121402 RepID=A0A8T2PFV5_9TELE|nr:hypothetical protein JZ751_022665 [Albula glossodonta]